MIPHKTFTEGRTYRFKTEARYKRWLARLETFPKETVSVWLHGPVLERIVLDYSQIENVEVDGIDTKDYPDFVDAYIASATYQGRDMTDDELDELNNDSNYVYDAVQERLY
jgi:hypothetical protein